MNARSRLSSMVLKLSALVAGTAVIASVAGHGAAQPSAATKAAAAPETIVWLDQNWTEAQRRAYHHQSQGTLTLPVPTSWFMALQQPENFSPSAGRFSDPAYLDRYGFIPSPQDGANPLGLPIGFARTQTTDPRTGAPVDRIGFTCAACHTGRIEHGGRTMLVDGGPAMIDLRGFGSKLALGLGETNLSPTRFRRFANRVLGENASGAARDQLHRQLDAVVRAGIGELLHSPGGVAEGFGRLDAINRIGNTVFGDGMGIRANNSATIAPVAFPHIWDTHWFSWVQYNGSIEQPMVRNAGEAMGVGAVVNYESPNTPRFTSTIPINHLFDPIEQSLRGPNPPSAQSGFSGLRSPAWPENILPSIDPALAARGAELYRQRCQGCHLPAPNTPDYWTSNRWLPANQAGERYLDLNMIPITTVGTDPAQAQGMRDRTVQVPLALGLPDPISSQGGMGTYSFGPALGAVVERVVNRWYDANAIPAAQRGAMNGNRPNGIRAPLQYKARPLNGVWATSPFLHNGSVLTLWELLSPYAERRSSFRLGTRAFDPVRVGYVSAGGFRLDTSKAGNRNSGHLFDVPTRGNRGVGIIGRPFTADERRALVEYLKTL